MKTKPEFFVIRFNTGQYLKEKVFKGCFNTCMNKKEAMRATKSDMDINLDYLKNNGYTCSIERVGK